MDLIPLLSTTTSKGNPNAWDISKAGLKPGTGAAFSLANGLLDDSRQIKNILSVQALPRDLFVSPDGLNFYVVGDTGDKVTQYTATDGRWMIFATSFVADFSVGAIDNAPVGMWFKPDGTKFFLMGNQNDSVFEFTLATPWAISTASYTGNSFSVATETTAPTGLTFDPSGTKMYVGGIYEYTLSTAWDITTASYTQTFALTAFNFVFNDDGTKIFYAYNSGNNNYRAAERPLTTPYDISTTGSITDFVGIMDGLANNGGVQARGVFFDKYGGIFYYIVYDNGSISGTAASRIVMRFTSGYFDVTAQETTPESLFFKTDGTKMYVLGRAGDDVNEYNLSTAWDVTTASYVQNFSVSAQETAPSSLYFKPDGTKMYVLGDSGNDVNEYTLSSAWDVSTASYTQNFSVGTQESEPTGLAFSTDGTNMYVVGAVGDDVNQYVLSTAWDISTASYLQNYSISAQETAPSGIAFSTDGVYMYTTGLGGTTNDLDQYVLTTPWDISTASFVQKNYLNSVGTEIEDIYFKPDGTEFFLIARDTPDQVVQFQIDPDL